MVLEVQGRRACAKQPLPFRGRRALRPAAFFLELEMNKMTLVAFATLSGGLAFTGVACSGSSTGSTAAAAASSSGSHAAASSTGGNGNGSGNGSGNGNG